MEFLQWENPYHQPGGPNDRVLSLARNLPPRFVYSLRSISTIDELLPFFLNSSQFSHVSLSPSSFPKPPFSLPFFPFYRLPLVG